MPAHREDCIPRSRANNRHRSTTMFCYMALHKVCADSARSWGWFCCRGGREQRSGNRGGCEVILDAKCGRKFHNKIGKGAHCSVATKKGVELSGQRGRRARWSSLGTRPPEGLVPRRVLIMITFTRCMCGRWSRGQDEYGCEIRSDCVRYLWRGYCRISDLCHVVRA